MTDVQSDTVPTKRAAAKSRAKGAPPPLATAPEAKGKIGILLGLLRREGGADIHDMAEATGWQLHSVRGALAGAIKKRLKIEVTSEKVGKHRIYRAAQPAAIVEG